MNSRSALRSAALALVCTPLLIASAPSALAGERPPATRPQFAWGSSGSGPGQFASPTGLACNAAGGIFVCDTGNGRVQRFTAEHAFVSAFGSLGSGPGEFRGAEFIALGPAGEVLVADYANHRVQIFDAGGAFVRAFGAAGTQPGEFNGAFGIAVTRAGDIVVGDAGNQRVQRFAWDGTFANVFETPPDGLGIPAGIAVSPAGDVFVADYVRHRILRFSATGTFLGAWGAEGATPGDLRSPVGLAIAVDRLFVADNGNRRVQSFTLTGQFVAVECDSLDSPFAVATDGLGHVYVSETGAHRVSGWVDAFTPTRRGSWGALKRRYAGTPR